MKNQFHPLFAQWIPVFILVLFSPVDAATQVSTIPFDSAGWEVISGKVTEVSGRKAFAGTAFLKNTDARNGIIEFDMLVTGQRSYPGVIFRQSEPGNYERIYIRPHLPAFFQNIVQYCGTFNDIDSWQLYSGEGYAASAAIVKNEWFHVKVEIHGAQARIFLNNQPKPSLFVRYLVHGDRTGQVGVSCAEDGSAFFSGFSWKSDNTLGFPAETAQQTPYGVIGDWQISPVFRMNSVDNERTLYQQGITDITWKKAPCRPDGIVDISRHYSRSGNLPEVIFAKTTLKVDADTSKMFAFGYSDLITVFLNGKLLFSGNSAYTSRDPSFQGVVGLNDYIVLPLKKGENELMISLTESFGGWGFIFRDAKAVYMDKSLTKKVKIREGFALPESAVYDKKRDVVYLSNYYNEGSEYISKISADGTIITAGWVTGIMQPTGLCISGDKLYAVGRYALIEIDPETGAILKRIRFPEPGMPNDVTADDEGNLFITDSQRNLIYRYSGGNMEVWIQSEDLVKPNGILYDQGNLLVGTSGDGCLKRINPDTRAISEIVCIGAGSIMDGITPDGKGGYLISDYNGRIFSISLTGDKKLLLDATAQPETCADFLFIPGKRLLIVPGFVNNTLTIYEIAPE